MRAAECAVADADLGAEFGARAREALFARRGLLFERRLGARGEREAARTLGLPLRLQPRKVSARRRAREGCIDARVVEPGVAQQSLEPQAVRTVAKRGRLVEGPRDS